MSLMRLRFTGSEDAARGLINLIASIDGVEHVEEVATLMGNLDDDDSSSAGLNSDLGPESRAIEVEVPNETAARRVRLLAEGLALETGAGVEFEEDGAWGDNQRSDTDEGGMLH
jgi:hypothetical protein